MGKTGVVCRRVAHGGDLVPGCAVSDAFLPCSLCMSLDLVHTACPSNDWRFGVLVTRSWHVAQEPVKHSSEVYTLLLLLALVGANLGTTVIMPLLPVMRRGARSRTPGSRVNASLRCIACANNQLNLGHHSEAR